MSEHAAHQFLRDGDCADDIDKVQRRLKEAKEMADNEIARVQKEEPDSLKTSEEPPKVRRFRPPEMRRDTPGTTAGDKEQKPTVSLEPTASLEVDEGIDDMDHDLPKPVYRSTRNMN